MVSIVVAVTAAAGAAGAVEEADAEATGDDAPVELAVSDPQSKDRRPA